MPLLLFISTRLSTRMKLLKGLTILIQSSCASFFFIQVSDDVEVTPYNLVLYPNDIFDIFQTLQNSYPLCRRCSPYRLVRKKNSQVPKTWYLTLRLNLTVMGCFIWILFGFKGYFLEYFQAQHSWKANSAFLSYQILKDHNHF